MGSVVDESRYVGKDVHFLKAHVPKKCIAAKITEVHEDGSANLVVFDDELKAPHYVEKAKQGDSIGQWHQPHFD